MRLNKKQIAKEKEFRKSLNGFDMPEDDVIDDMDIIQKMNRQIRITNYKTEVRNIEREEEKNQENERTRLTQHKCDKKRVATVSAGNATASVPMNNKKYSNLSTGNAAASVPLSENDSYDEDTVMEGCAKDDGDADPEDSDSSDDDSDDSDRSNSDKDDVQGNEEDRKMSGREVTNSEKTVTEDDLDTNRLFNTNLFQHKNIWKLAQTLRTLQDTIKDTGQNIESCIEAE